MNNSSIRVLISDTFDPWFNLATEDWIFRDMDPRTRILYLWRNQDTVVIGRFQNPWAECNLKKMDEDGVKLARRQSGGGAVFQDLGNTNFTFMAGPELYDKAANNTIIVKALEKFGVQAMPSGRNDILVEDKKISGSAFKESKDRKFHHGTLLINANLEKLSNYLSPDKKKLVSKGIQSVRSRVANLTEFSSQINHESLTQAIIQEFFNYYQNECEVEYLGHNYLSQISHLNQYYEFLKNPEWRLGETPQFSHHVEERFSWGQMDVHFQVDKGIISKTVIFSDSLHPEMVEQLIQKLQGCAYHSQTVKTSLSTLKEKLPMVEAEIEEFSDWLAKEI